MRYKNYTILSLKYLYNKTTSLLSKLFSIPGLIVSSLPNKCILLLPRQKCSIMWNISSGFLTEPYSGYKQDLIVQTAYILVADFMLRENANSIECYLFSDDDIQINISMDKISILISPYCTLNTHQAVFLIGFINSLFLEPLKSFFVHFKTANIHWCIDS